MVAVVDCPVCARKLRIPEELLDDTVRCPTCGGTFASPDAPQAPLPCAPAAPVPTESVAPLEIAPRQTIPGVPALRPMLVSEEKGKPNSANPPALAPPRDDRRCPACGEDAPLGVRCCSACGESIGDAADMPWPYRDCEPHRAGLVLGLGIVSVVLAATCLLSFFGLPVAVAAWVMGQRDLEKMRKGTMDPEGKNTTHAGWICGIVGTVLNTLLVVYLALAFVGRF